LKGKFLKKILSAGIILVLMISLVSCKNSGINQKVSFETQEFSDGNYSYQIPVGWQEVSRSFGTGMHFFAPVDMMQSNDGVRIMNYKVSGDEQSLKIYEKMLAGDTKDFEKMIATYGTQVTEFKREKYKAGGHQVVMLSYISEKSGQKTKNVQCYPILDEVTVCVSTEDKQLNGVSASEAAKNIADTFKVIKK
jgi:hypothetical protein